MRKNHYPLHLEHDYENFIGKIVSDYLRQIVNLCEKALSTRSRSDSLNSDADDTEVLIRMLMTGGGPVIDSEELQRRIERHYQLIDAYSRDKARDLIARSYAYTNSKKSESVTGRVAPVDRHSGEKAYELWLDPVNLSKHITDEKLQSVIRLNTNLIKSLTEDEKATIAATLKNGLLKGRKMNDIIEDIRHEASVSSSKARFWARDQASKFFGEVTRERQTGAGVPGYVWRTIGDIRTRDAHSALEGTYHEWKHPPKVYVNGILKSAHPGEDFNCRCFAEPAFGPEFADRQYEGPDSLKGPMTEMERKQRAGIVPARWSNTGDFRERVAIDLPGGAIRREVEGAFDDIAQTMRIPAQGYNGRAYSVSLLSPSSPMYTNARGVFSPRSGHIYLDPANPYSRSTTVHEIFHGLYPKIVTDAPEEYYALMRAVKKTERYKDIKSRGNNYALQETEIFSRLMESYVSNRSGKGYNEFLEKASISQLYWVDEKEKHLYTLLDRIFMTLGWK